MANDNLILQYVLPHHNIKAFTIEGYGGVAICSSINPFTNLVGMKIDGCKRLQSLPPLHLLLHLKSLDLHDLPSLAWIDNNKSDANSSTYFPSVKWIFLEELHNVKGWCRCGEEGKAKDCPDLISLPQHKYIRSVNLQKVNEKILQQAVCQSQVEINGLKSLSGILQCLAVLRDLSVSVSEELDVCNDENGSYSMQWKQLTSLRRLKFDRITKMKYLPEGLQHVTTLESIEIRACPNLRSIAEWTRPLERFQIRRCPSVFD